MKYKLVKAHRGGDYDGLFDLSTDRNPKWPPQHSALILAKKGNHSSQVFLGVVVKLIWNKTAALLRLYNHKDYIEELVVSGGVIPAQRGYFILMSSYAWKYVQGSTIKLFERMGGDLDRIEELGASVKSAYSQFHDSLREPELQVKGLDGDDEEESKIAVVDIYDELNKSTGAHCSANDDFKDTSLLSNLGTEPNGNRLFSESRINKLLSAPDELFTAPSAEKAEGLQGILLKFENIPEEEERIVVNKTVALENMIKYEEDEINEGNKIIDWMTKKMTRTDNLFSDLKFMVDNGYVHISRVGAPAEDVVSRELVPDLKYFTWQYGRDIDYHTLKYTLVQNSFQKSLDADIAQQKEAETILGLEYLIAFQPQPKYVAWVLKRIIECWYADVDLQNSIRKVKVLINLWRGRSDREFNQQHGILPIIVVYPKYGNRSARLVLSRLTYYFSLYRELGWKCSQPTYFIKTSPLIYYTNGALDLKMYFRRALKAKKTSDVDPELTAVSGSKDLMIT